MGPDNIRFSVSSLRSFLDANRPNRLEFGHVYFAGKPSSEKAEITGGTSDQWVGFTPKYLVISPQENAISPQEVTFYSSLYNHYALCNDLSSTPSDLPKKEAAEKLARADLGSLLSQADLDPVLASSRLTVDFISVTSGAMPDDHSIFREQIRAACTIVYPDVLPPLLTLLEKKATKVTVADFSFYRDVVGEMAGWQVKENEIKLPRIYLEEVRS